MKKILLVVTLFVLGICYSGKSQSETETFAFNFIESKLDAADLNKAEVQKHYMGQEVANKLQMLKDSYTWVEPGTATNPTPRGIVEKPAIYYSIKKLDKYYKKAIKNAQMDEPIAREAFVKALDIALLIRHQETNSFESKLRQIKEDADIALLYSERVTLKF